ncbi:hypothetical protein CLV60_106231 [Dyadobacter jiangsuensis]|uniref:Uncharacterized protein n=1 Tax=Dyadobacter jiangsuensis TaxID=1591085 RepID=A0A2P8G3S1_9BACT|nr:hypothetical protein CLV60_106231 [Dyadobacter jiangsuensis]
MADFVLFVRLTLIYLDIKIGLKSPSFKQKFLEKINFDFIVIVK